MDHPRNRLAPLRNDSKLRRETFQNGWPPEKNFLSIDELVNQGFYFLGPGNGDRVQCVYCAGILSNWEPNDNILTEHKRNFPQCPMMKSPCKMAAYRDLSTRKSSFTGWPPQMRQKPDDLAEAGLFYLGQGHEGDKAKCFWCGGMLSEWEANDIPIVEHAKSFPQCQWLVASKGKEFVERIQQHVQQGTPVQNEHQENTENVDQGNVDDNFLREFADELEDDLENGSNEGSSDYETDDEQSFYEQFKDWDELSDEDQSNTKSFLDENYTVQELQFAFNIYSAAKGRPTAGQFRKFILRSPGMPKKRKSLVDMTKTIEEKEIETSELKIKLHDTKCAMVKQASVLHNFDRDLCKSNECIDKIKVQYEKVHDKNQKLFQANTENLEKFKLFQRDCNTLLAVTKEKDQTISNQDDCIKSLTKQNNDQDDSIKSLKMESIKLQKKISKQGEVNFDLMKEKTLLQEENKDFKVKYTALKKMSVKQKIELEEKDRSIQKQKLIYQELKSELSDTNSRLETVEKELMNKNCEISKLKSNQKEEHNEMKQLQAQVAELKEMLNSRNAVAENEWPACTIL